MQTLWGGIFEISETYLPLISKTVSEPIRHLFASFDTFQKTKFQNDLSDLFHWKWEENEDISQLHSKILTARAAFLSGQDLHSRTLHYEDAPRKHHEPRTTCADVRLLVCEGRQKGTPSGWHYLLKSYKMSCMKPDFQGWLAGRWKPPQ